MKPKIVQVFRTAASIIGVLYDDGRVFLQYSKKVLHPEIANGAFQFEYYWEEMKYPEI